MAILDDYGKMKEGAALQEENICSPLKGNVVPPPLSQH